MSWRRIVITLLALLSVGAGLVGVTTGAQASPQAPQATYGAPKEGAKVILNETSSDGPAIASAYPGDIIAWAGTDSAHTLNIIHRTTHPQTQDKKILWGWSSISRPNLSYDLANDSKSGQILSWTGLNNRLYFAYSAKDTSDRTFWTMASASPLSLKSAWAPSMIGFTTSTQPSHWLAWTGSGVTSTHALNVRYTQRYPSWGDANSQATLNETAISGPALAIRSTSGEPQAVIGWTGTDPDHHLNVAVVTAPA